MAWLYADDLYPVTTGMMLAWALLLLALLTTPSPGLCQRVLDPAAVPCNYRGPPEDGDWLYMSTSTMVITPELVLWGNFTDIGGVYEDGVSCDPALFFLSRNIPHRPNVSLFQRDTFHAIPDRLAILPSDVTLLNLTFSVRKPEHATLLRDLDLTSYPGLLSLAVRAGSVNSISELGLQATRKLLILDLSYNNISSLEGSSFDGMWDLMVIILNGNPIVSIDQDVFCGFSLPRLYSVNLLDALTELPSGMFSTPWHNCSASYYCDLTYLNLLRLSRVQTEGVLEPFAFSRLKKMDNELQLCGSALTGISHDAFACVTNLKNLFLCDNKIQYLSHEVFSHLSGLQQLLLNNNSLDIMPAWIFRSNLDLVYLNASYNMLQTLDGRFTDLPQIVYLDLSHNRIRSIRNSTFSYCDKLQRLYLQYNNLSEIEPSAFVSVHSLQILNLAHNRLTYVSEHLFADMTSLSELYLNNNLISQIEANVFLTVERVEILNLAHNRLSHVPEDLFADMSSLRELHLNDNALRHLNADIFVVRSAILSTVTLGGNPWDCNCELDPLRLWLKKYGNITLDLQDATCSGQEQSISSSDSFCAKEQNPLLPMIGILIAIFFVLVAGSGTVYRFRLDIQLLLFAKCGIRVSRKRFPLTEDQKRTYDAFVSYNSSDQRFVLRELMPKLERKPPFYKLCLHFRDFALGAAVAENIVEAIDTSKRTIMLVSKDFLQSDWCQYEFQMAHHQVLTEGGRNRLILVMMEQIDISDITDHTLKSYIRTHTYIEKNDPRFWERLRFALPDKKDTADTSAAQKHG